METINVHEAKTHLSKIIERVVRGESVIIGRAGKPVAVLSPYNARSAPRCPGSMKGRIEIGDDFDASDESIAELFAAAADRK